MATNKKDLFTEQEQKAADFARVLSHPARIAILDKLALEHKCVCGQIVEVLPLAQSTVSQHLKELKAAGLIQGEIEGAASCYCINWENLEKQFDNFQKLFEDLKKQKNISCC